MRRRTFDTLMSLGGLVITIVLVVAGALLLVGHNFADSNVRKQLAEQKITFPAKGSEALKDSRIGPFLTKYAGQQLTTGAQAEAYANHYIKVHITDTGKGTYYGGKTYAEMGSLVRANPDDKKLAAARETVFKGETLRGLLLNAYAWWKMGQIALWAAWGAYAAAVVMGILTVLGFVHRRKVSENEEVFAPHVLGKRGSVRAARRNGAHRKLTLRRRGGHGNQPGATPGWFFVCLLLIENRLRRLRQRHGTPRCFRWSQLYGIRKSIPCSPPARSA